MGQPLPPRGTIAHPRSSPTAQPLDFDRAVPGAKLTNLSSSTASAAHATPYLPIMDASHHVDVAPLAGSHALRHAATHCTHTPSSRKEGCHRLVSLRHFVHFVKGGRPQTRLTSSLRPLCHFSLSHHLVCHESTSQAHAYCDRPRRLCHATLSIHARGPFTEGSVRLAATGHRLSSRRRATRATACHRPSAR